ncbi:hypothetical protein M422DRAFT_264286 [Sphaerobolus stellatus SS14]|uniref:Uncharacterized protein n=1 Tax=Sphaerobolus stellatus (strain SS14) TaxID=990650 RepID=A0A0C9UWL4_SPHS4|nr:hypothetical protein M422DRAFT_264286 [Sphaerobolus stellatus SS14]
MSYILNMVLSQEQQRNHNWQHQQDPNYREQARLAAIQRRAPKRQLLRQNSANTESEPSNSDAVLQIDPDEESVKNNINEDHRPWMTVQRSISTTQKGGEKMGLCCFNGKKIAPPLPPPPHCIQALMYHAPILANKLSAYSHSLNNLFAFTALGTTGQFVHFETGISAVSITGRTYHWVLNAARDQNSIHWFLYDELCLFHDVDEGIPTALELTETSSNGDFAAIIHAENTANVQPRSVLIWQHSDYQPMFMSIYSRHYEPLQYPLLFLHGTLGWGLPSDIGNLNLDDKNVIGFTQMQWYRN